MALHITAGKPEYGPFSASVGTDGDFECGMIRIEPPILPGERITQWANDEGILLDHFASTKQATLLDYGITSHLQGTREENITRISKFLDTVLGHLGQTASKQLFEHNWAKFGN